MIAHIGYPKAASTFFQKNVFPHMEGIKFYNLEDCRRLIRDICFATTLEYDAEAMREKIDCSPNAVYSYEWLSGRMGFGSYDYEIAVRLKDTGFTKIIIVVRRQDKWLESMYRQYVQQGGVLPPSSYPEDDIYFRWAYMDTLPLISHYVDLFGKENVHLICFEDMLNSMDKMLEGLKDFCGSEKVSFPAVVKEKHKSLTYQSIKVLRFMNHFTYNFYRPSNIIPKVIRTRNVRKVLEKCLDPFFSGKKQFYDDDFRAEVLNKYRESNRKLSEEFNLDLDKYGYF